jgi:hypothetical protein
MTLRLRYHVFRLEKTYRVPTSQPGHPVGAQRDLTLTTTALVLSRRVGLRVVDCSWLVPWGPDCHARMLFKTWWLVLGETSSPTTHHPPSDRPLSSKTKVVVVTGIKKNSNFGLRLRRGKKTAGLESRIFQKGSLTSVRENFRVKKFRRVFFRLNFLKKSGTSFWIFDFGGLPFSNHVSP